MYSSHRLKCSEEANWSHRYAYKAILNEKFGDGIMSAISFSTKVEKETDEKGDWVKITLRGKW